MLKSNISILGATGHIGKNLSIYFGKDKNFELFLFAAVSVEVFAPASSLHQSKGLSCDTRREHDDSFEEEDWVQTD